MPKKKELTGKETEEFYKWDSYSLDCFRFLKDDEDSGLDSNFIFSAYIFIKPDKKPENIYMQKLTNFFRGITKEKKFSSEEMPDFFRFFYFDEIHIKKNPTYGICPTRYFYFDKPNNKKIKAPDIYDDIGESLNIFKENYERGYPVLRGIEMELNSKGKQYRQKTELLDIVETELNSKGKQYRQRAENEKYITGYFGVRDSRFKHFIDSLSLYNEFMPSQSMPRQQFIDFFNGLEDIKNRIFKFENPEFKGPINTLSLDGIINHGTNLIEKHRFQIPLLNVKLRDDINENIEKILKIRNELWKIIYPDKDRKTNIYNFGYFSKDPMHDYFFGLLTQGYDRELQIGKIANRCLNCGDMFQYKTGKKFCSTISEGKDCGKKYRSNQDYIVHREKRKLYAKKYMSWYREQFWKHDDQ